MRLAIVKGFLEIRSNGIHLEVWRFLQIQHFTEGRLEALQGFNPLHYPLYTKAAMLPTAIWSQV